MLGALQYNDSINNQIASSGSGGRLRSGVCICISLSLGGGTYGSIQDSVMNAIHSSINTPVFYCGWSEKNPNVDGWSSERYHRHDTIRP